MQALPIAISDLSHQFENDESKSFDEITARRIVFTTANLLEGTLGTQNVLEGVLRDAISDHFATEVLNECGQRRNSALKNWNTIDNDKLDIVFRERMRIKYESGTSSFFSNEGALDIVPLGRWALCGSEGREEVRKYLLREFHSRHSNLGSFLAKILPSDGTDTIQDPGAKDALDVIKIYFPLKEVAKLLDDYGESSYSSPQEAQVIQEFRSQYKNA